MRILHVDSGYEMRGGQWQVLYLLRGLRERGHELKLIARGALLERARAEGFETVSGGWRTRRWAEVVHAHDARSHTWAAMFASRALAVSRRVAFPIRRGCLSRWKYARARHYIAVSQFVASKLVEADLKPESISVVYDGVPLVTERGTLTGGIVVSPASADPMKGRDLALEAGRLADVNIVFSGNLPADLPRASVLLYLTRSEGLGSAALLAMAYGIPVVASRVGGLAEVVADGRSGFLVDNDAPAIAAAIRGLLEDAGLRERMGQEGRAIAERRFSLASMVEGTLRAYEKVRT